MFFFSRAWGNLWKTPSAYTWLLLNPVFSCVYSKYKQYLKQVVPTTAGVLPGQWLVRGPRAQSSQQCWWFPCSAALGHRHWERRQLRVGHRSILLLFQETWLVSGKSKEVFLFCFYNNSSFAICCFLFSNLAGAMKLMNNLGACFLSCSKDLKLHTGGPEACALEKH